MAPSTVADPLSAGLYLSREQIENIQRMRSATLPKESRPRKEREIPEADVALIKDIGLQAFWRKKDAEQKAARKAARAAAKAEKENQKAERARVKAEKIAMEKKKKLN